MGGIAWGILADRTGRLSVLFGSIITYSLANIACGFVQDPSWYAALRFLAGLGLAGELGAGITLVSEILPQQLRGYGASIVASVGLLGTIVAYFTVVLFDWRVSYFIGGGLGLLLLLLRLGVVESGMFKIAQTTAVARGSLWAFVNDKTRFLRYIRCIGVGLPTYFVIGLLATFGNEFGKALGIVGEVQSARCVLFTFVGIVLGDVFGGLLSQVLQSRRRAIATMISMTLLGCFYYLFGHITTPNTFYGVCGYLGFSIGYVALFLTVTAESFGTNLRATATSTVANFVRATTLLTIPFFQYLKPTMGVVAAGSLVGFLCFVLSYLSLFFMEETFSKDLNYVETV